MTVGVLGNETVTDCEEIVVSVSEISTMSSSAKGVAPSDKCSVSANLSARALSAAMTGTGVALTRDIKSSSLSFPKSIPSKKVKGGSLLSMASLHLPFMVGKETSSS